MALVLAAAYTYYRTRQVKELEKRTSEEEKEEASFIPLPKNHHDARRFVLDITQDSEDTTTSSSHSCTQQSSKSPFSSSTLRQHTVPDKVALHERVMQMYDEGISNATTAIHNKMALGSSSNLSSSQNGRQQQITCEGDNDVVRMAASDVSENHTVKQSSYFTPTTEPSSVFLPSVRKDWMDAVFGHQDSKCSDNGTNESSVIQGVGLSGIDSYTIQNITIQPTSTHVLNDCSDGKLGVAVSRLPLGLYVRHIQPGSEAEIIGVQLNSVLVSINGCLNLLAEPSKAALERLWQYEGHFTCSGDIPAASDSASQSDGLQHTLPSTIATHTGTTSNTNLTALGVTYSGTSDFNGIYGNVVREPVSLTFINGGRFYTVLLLSNPPWGIQWAPACNHVLVKRSYGSAADAGVLRGCLVLSVNDVDCEDHTETATKLRALHISRDTIHLKCGFPPSKARSGYYERNRQHLSDQNADDKETTSTQSLKRQDERQQRIGQPHVENQSRILSFSRRRLDDIKKSMDGVEVKFLPLGYAISSLCYSADLVRPGHVAYNRNTRSITLFEHYAEQVAAGFVAAPPHGISNDHRNDIIRSLPSGLGKLYNPCPTLLMSSSINTDGNSVNNKSCKSNQIHSNLLHQWDQLDALLYCIQFQRSSYNEAIYVEQHVRRNSMDRSNPLDALDRLASEPSGAEMVSSFLLQFISIICWVATSGHYKYHDDPCNKNDEVLAPESEAVDASKTESTDDIYNKQDNVASRLTSILLTLSRRNEEFCQRLYFLLRSYISTFETSKSAIPSDNGDSINDNISALLNCLELLRFAESEMAGRRSSQVIESSLNNERPRRRCHSDSRLSFKNDWNEEKHSFSSSYERSDPSKTHAPNNVLPSRCSSNFLTPNAAQVGARTDQVEKSKRGVLRFLRKKPVTSEKRQSRRIRKQGRSELLVKSSSSRDLVKSSSSRDLVDKTTEPCTTDSVLVSNSSALSSSPSSRISASSSTFLTQQSPSTMYDIMSEFLSELDKICGTIERTLQRSFRQKIADWAMQPWSVGKDAALAEVTNHMRKSLREASSANKRRNLDSMLLVNPVEPSELLSSIDYDDCYILPSAHFPILLTFNVSEKRSCPDSVSGTEGLYRTRITLRSLKGFTDIERKAVVVQGSVGGSTCVSGESELEDSSSDDPCHRWNDQNELVFETRSLWGVPKTIAIRVSGSSENVDESGNFKADIGFCWLDISDHWDHHAKTSNSSVICSKAIEADLWPMKSAENTFDDHGVLPMSTMSCDSGGKMLLEMSISTELIEFDDENTMHNVQLSRKRMLLYKHDDDLRQEAFAVQFIKTCDNLLKASGLDMKLLTFQCVPVGAKRGFVEWVPGSVPLSEICRPVSADNMFGATATTSVLDAGVSVDQNVNKDNVRTYGVRGIMGVSKYESLRKLGRQPYNEMLRRMKTAGRHCERGSIANEPIQDYLRSVAFDSSAPYLIRKDVMDTYVKSCAGYSVIAYVLGVGDRHLDNLLLHHTGAFFHCDYSFILGRDPKTFLPMRVTEDMIYGMGGRESDNYAKFLSLTCAAFLTLRRPENVRVLVSMIRLMKASCLPDVSEHQPIEQAIIGVRNRLRLDLTSDVDAIEYMEVLVEASLSNKLWLAVDVMHSLGKQF